MKVIDNTELKHILLDMLSELHGICEEYRLTYFLTGGTLLGAVRHKGFIPWDDDIDILMPRSDYQKLISLSKDIFKERNLEVVNHHNTSGYIYPFAKLVHNKTIADENVDSQIHFGVWIDIFPLDNMSDDKVEAERLFDNIKFYRNLLSIKNIKNDKNRGLGKSIMLTAGKICTFFIGRKFILNKIDTHCRRYQGKNFTKYVCVSSVGTYGKKEIMDSCLYSKPELIEFEGRLFNAPVGYKTILTHLYGEYMKLPPKEKQISHHSFTAYWVD